ncbi:MAG: toprim domain-containing protein [Eubacteriales bacterium]
MEKMKIDLPIIVEGKYDKIKILSIADACVIATDGFGVFKNSERLSLIKRLARQSKIIVLTDSDGAGKLIRSHITSAIPRERIIQLYTPQVKGKERRKTAPSAEGYLGVEGTEAETLRQILMPFSSGMTDDFSAREEITKADMFEAGLTGAPDSAERRDELALSLGLPRGMTPNALLAALNVLMRREEFTSKYQKRIQTDK